MSSIVENKIQTNIIQWINKQPGCIAENVSGNAKQSGRADINACINGRCVKIEVKRPDTNYTVTKKQELYLRKWKRAGAYCFSCESFFEAREVITALMEFSIYQREEWLYERGLSE